MAGILASRRAVLGAAGALIGSVACPGILRAQGTLQKLSVLISTAPADPAFHVFYFAQEKGFYREEGLEIEPRPTAGDATAVRVLLSGAADIASVGALPTMQAVAAGTQLRIVSCFNPKLDYLLVAQEGISNPKELEGRAVAVSQVGATSHFIPQLMIKAAGGDPSKVNWLSVGASSARVQALIARRVEAAPLNAVFAARAQQNGRVRVIGDAGRDLPDLVYAWEIVTPRTLEQKRAALQAFVTATAKAARWAAENGEEAAAISRRVLPDADPAETGKAITDFAARTFWGASGQLPQATWDFTVSSMRDLGIISTVPRAEDLVVRDFADAAAGRLGPFRR